MTLVSNLRELAPLNLVCELFDVKRSRYYARCQSARTIDAERLVFRAAVKEKHRISRSSAGSRSIVSMLATDRIRIGRFKVRRLMKEANVVSKQPGEHKYKTALDERLEISNTLDRKLNVIRPNAVWCGDTTYIWAGGRWVYLAVILDLYRRRIVGWSISNSPIVLMQHWLLMRWNTLTSNEANRKTYCFILTKVLLIIGSLVRVQSEESYIEEARVKAGFFVSGSW